MRGGKRYSFNFVIFSFDFENENNAPMKTYIADIIPKIQRFSLKLDNLTKLTNYHWVSIGDIDQNKRVYIFRNNNQLLISENGIVDKGTWEYLGNQSLLLETHEGSFLMEQGFIDNNILVLKLDSTDNYVFFVNESTFDGEFNTVQDVISFLEAKYIYNQQNLDLSNAEPPYIFTNPENDLPEDELSNQQKEWIENPNQCPACGFVGVEKLDEYPDCGISLLN